jgi:hypothetical protein
MTEKRNKNGAGWCGKTAGLCSGSPETGIMERELKRVQGGRLYLIPASEESRGHATTGMAKLWQQQLQEFLAAVPKRGM